MTLNQNDIVMGGRAWLFGDNILIDGEIMSADYAVRTHSTPEELARYVMVGLDPDFPNRVQAGDVIVAGKHFGIGNFHSQGIVAMKALGIGVVAESVTRVILRLSVCLGLPLLPSCPGITQLARQGAQISVNFRTGHVDCEGRVADYQPLPDSLYEIINLGGEQAYIKRALARQSR